MIQEITQRDIVEHNILNGTDLVVLMFYGPTCGPCRATIPYYEQVAQFYTEKQARIRFYKINAWEPEEQKTYITEVWKVTGVPTFKLFNHDIVVADKVGGGDFNELHKLVHSAIDESFKLFEEKI